MMDKKRLYGLIVIVIFAVIDWVLLLLGGSELCAPSVDGRRTVCEIVFIKIAEPMAVVFVALIFAYAVALFAGKSVFRIWKIFSFVTLSLVLIWVFIFEEHSFLGPPRSVFALWLSILYLTISLLLIVYKSWRLKKEKPTYSSGK